MLEAVFQERCTFLFTSTLALTAQMLENPVLVILFPRAGAQLLGANEGEGE